jgi:2-polyprenyl-3-methyl-5-hydroxy-6-metoxy-1,4-benzoquinol methylase
MNDYDKQVIITRYTERFKNYGIDIKTLASGNKDRQIIRFKVLAEVGNLEGCSILDVGCGFGDFYDYLKGQKLKVEYTGIDICPPFIDVCKERFPEAHFEIKDIQKDSFKQKFDYVVSSQTFNNKLKIESNEEVIRDVIRRCYEICNIAVAIDMLTSYVDFKEGHLYYYSPEEIFKFCKTLTKRVTLRHDYPLFEFTVYI